MTAVLDAPAPPTSAPEVKRRRRWPRIAIPFTVLVTIVVGTLILHSLNQPDRTDRMFLSPADYANGAPISGSLLAQRLQDRGVQIHRFTSTPGALDLAFQGGYTLFVPAPSLMHRDYVQMLWDLPSNTRVVLVDPSPADLSRGNAPIRRTDRRWAPKAVSPGDCRIPGLDGAGPAGVYESAYAGDSDLLLREHSCYAGAVFQFHWTAAEVIAVGSADPFRDDRIDEYANSDLAVGLLSTKHDLLWLDVHETEPGPKAQPDEPIDGVDTSPPPGTTEDPGTEDPGDPGGAGSDPGGGGDPAPSGGNQQADGPSFWEAFPPAMWATLVGALLLGLLLALWQARRLGAPVTEPLPFSVKGSETVLGRAQLYQRAGAILTGAQTLRRTIGPQIAQALGLPPMATPEELTAEITARYGGNPAIYLDLLADALPKRDTDLVRLAADLDSLLAMVSTPLDPADGEISG